MPRNKSRNSRKLRRILAASRKAIAAEQHIRTAQLIALTDTRKRQNA